MNRTKEEYLKYIEEKYSTGLHIKKEEIESKKKEIKEMLTCSPYSIIRIYEILRFDNILGFDYFVKNLKKMLPDEYLFARNKICFLSYRSDIQNAVIDFKFDLNRTYSALIKSGSLKKKGRGSNGQSLSKTQFEELFNLFDYLFECKTNRSEITAAESNSEDLEDLNTNIPDKDKPITTNEVRVSTEAQNNELSPGFFRDENKELNKKPVVYVQNILNSGGWSKVLINDDSLRKRYLFGENHWDLREERFFSISYHKKINRSIVGRLVEAGAFAEYDLLAIIGDAKDRGFFRFYNGEFIKLSDSYKIETSNETQNLRTRGSYNMSVLESRYLN